MTDLVFKSISRRHNRAHPGLAEIGLIAKRPWSEYFLASVHFAPQILVSGGAGFPDQIDERCRRLQEDRGIRAFLFPVETRGEAAPMPRRSRTTRFGSWVATAPASCAEPRPSWLLSASTSSTWKPAWAPVPTGAPPSPRPCRSRSPKRSTEGGFGAGSKLWPGISGSRSSPAGRRSLASPGDSRIAAKAGWLFHLFREVVLPALPVGPEVSNPSSFFVFSASWP